MDKTEKEKLLALVEAKKQGRQKPFAGKQDIFSAQGEARKSKKKYRKGGLFDK